MIAPQSPAAPAARSLPGHRDQRAEALDPAADFLGAGLQRRAVDDQARADVGDVLDLDEAVGRAASRRSAPDRRCGGTTPSSGASSIAPFSLMHSAWTPRAAKWRRVTSGYFVATRRWLQLSRVLVRRPTRPARPRPCGNARYRGRAARRSRNSRTPSARRCRRPRAGPRRRRRRSRHRSCAPGSGRAPGREVRNRSCRLAGSLKAGSGSTPMRCNSGMTSPRMRPFGKRHDQRLDRSTGVRLRARAASDCARQLTVSSSSWPGCHGVGQGSPKSRARHTDAPRRSSRIVGVRRQNRDRSSAPARPRGIRRQAYRQQAQDAVLLAAAGSRDRPRP